jgi:hypothetical protein
MELRQAVHSHHARKPDTQTDMHAQPQCFFSLASTP